MSTKMDRRGFLATGARTVAAVAAGGVAGSMVPAFGAGEARPDILNYEPGMRYRKLGKAGLMLSEISLGGHWRTREGERYWGDFPGDVPPADVRDREDVVGRAIDLGANSDITTQPKLPSTAGSPASATVCGV
jgi:hypothetical protein